MTNTSQRLVYQIFGQPTWCLRIFALLAGAPLVRATRRPIRKQTDRSFSSVRFFVTTTNNSFCSCKRHITTDSANRGISDVSSRRQKKFTSIPSPKLYSNTPGSLRQRKAAPPTATAPAPNNSRPNHLLHQTTLSTTNHHQLPALSALFQCEPTLLPHQHSAYTSAEPQLSHASTAFHRFTPYGGAWSSVFHTQ